MEPQTSLPIFLSSVVLVSLSGVMAPGPVFAVTVARGYESRKAGILIALGHGLVEVPLIFLLFFGLSEFSVQFWFRKRPAFSEAQSSSFWGYRCLKTAEK